MTPSGDNRSVHAGGDITGASVVTGDHNTVTTTAHVRLPPTSTVDPKAELSALRDLLASLNVPERGRLDRALQDAEEEAAKPDPDKGEVADAVQRVLKAAKGANAFAEQIEKLAPRVAALAAWVGPAGHALLSLVGLSA
jgi:hypothetical protein